MIMDIVVTKSLDVVDVLTMIKVAIAHSVARDKISRVINKCPL